jgi:hypothetical protein
MTTGRPARTAAPDGLVYVGDRHCRDQVGRRVGERLDLRVVIALGLGRAHADGCVVAVAARSDAPADDVGVGVLPGAGAQLGQLHDRRAIDRSQAIRVIAQGAAPVGIGAPRR